MNDPLVLIEPDYRGSRIELNAVAEGDHWNAEVRIRQHAVHAKPHVEIVSCYKLTAEHAERAGMLWARRWIDSEHSES